MKRFVPSDRAAFTLVELMTVVAIIGILIGILVPALSAARTQAKKAATQGQIDSIGKGAIMFQSDNDKLPRSRGANPFEATAYNAAPTPPLSGAQWLVLQLNGADLQGYVKDTLANDAPASVNAASVGKIDQHDWLDWYAIEPVRKYSRVAPLVESDAKRLSTPDQYRQTHPEVPGITILMGNNDGGNGGSSYWHNGKLPFYVDAFGFPILYYAANQGAEKAITTGTPTNNFVVGRYDMADNAHFTGSAESVGRYPFTAGSDGWDIAGRGLTNNRHPMGSIGYTVDGSGRAQVTWPAAETFAAAILDRNIYETSKRGSGGSEQGKLWPVNPETFILLSAGPDGLYGTDDDIKNYQNK